MGHQDTGERDAGGNSPGPDLFASERVRRVTPAAEPDEEAFVGRVGRDGRTWRDGSGTTRAWNGTVLAYAAFSVGAAVLVVAAARAYLPVRLGMPLSSLALWIGMAVPVVVALRRSRPRGLLRFRGTDILWGLGLGVLLRVAQGWLESAAGGASGLPMYPTLDGQLGAAWLLIGLFGPVLIAPLVEEFLFRGVVLVTVYRTAGRGLEAGILAVVASAAVFVAVHTVDGVPRWDEPVSLALVGMTCSVLVLLTGRIWGAVLVHAVFNGVWVALALVGTALA